MNRLHALVVTFERTEQLRETLDALSRQTRRPDTLTVVDNSGRDPVPATVHPTVTKVIATGDNLGPAGGLATGVSDILDEASDDDWVVFVDDDDPPLRDDALEQVLRCAERRIGAGQRVGGVGLAGGRFSRSIGSLSRVPDYELIGDVSLDYLGGNQLPTYRCGALRRAGGPDADLFFGFDDLELGLRLQDKGFEVIAPGDLWAALRRDLGRMGMTARDAAAIRSSARWRRYYSTRNLIHITRRHGSPGAALLATVRYGLVRAVVDAVRFRSWRSGVPAARGAIDAWRGRLGRTVTPA